MATYTLFNQIPAYAIFDSYLEEIRKDIDGKSNDYVLNVDEEEWRQYYVDKYDFEPLTVFPEKAEVFFKSKGKREIEQYGDRYQIDTHTFEFRMPFTGASFLFSLSPSHRTMNHPTVTVTEGTAGFVTAVFTLIKQDEQSFEYEKRNLINAITANVPNINADLRSFSSRVVQTYNSAYNQKKQKVLSENSFFEKLNIKRNTDTEKIFQAPRFEKKKVPEPIVDKKPPSKFVQSPTLPDEHYKDVIEVIYTFFKAVEKKPSIYKTKDEEALRDYVLPMLETRYESTTVTGETFNKRGKTDILIRHTDGSNLFVAECKFWKGQVQFHATINQLFDRYLTWRDSKVAIILFVKNKAFSSVLQTIQESVKEHPYFARATGVTGESSFSYIFHFPTDKGKFVFAEIMAFHFPESIIE